MTKNNPRKIKENEPPPKDLTAEVTFVPQGAMVKPRSYIVSINGKALQSFIRETIESDLKSNKALRAQLKRQ